MTAPISRHNISATIDDLPGIGMFDNYSPEIKSADVTLDDAWVPYGQLTLVCALPDDEAITEAIDPRDDHQVRVTIRHDQGPYIGDEGTGLEQLWASTSFRDFIVLLVGRDIDRKAKTMTLRCDTYEAALIGDALVDTEPDTYPFTIQDSLREIVDYVLDRHGANLVAFDPIDPGNEADAQLMFYENETNLITNPSIEVNTTGWAGTNCTIAKTASGFAVTGANVLRLSSPTSATSFAQISAITVTPGTTYVLSGYGYVNGTASGTASSLARRMVIVRAGTGTVEAQTVAMPASGMTGPQQLTAEWTCPAGVTSIDIRVYLGTTVGDVRYDAMKFCVKSRVLDPYEAWDGDTPDTDVYTYSWTGTAGNSTSTRVAVTGASVDYDALTWQPGVTAWDFLDALVQAAGLRLYCDEWNEWHLVNYPGEPAGALTLGEDDNLTDATDKISRYAEWFDAAVITYRWTTAAGATQTAYDVAQIGAGTPKRVYTETRDTPYPGVGYAAAVLERMNGRGRVFELVALSDYTTTPGFVLTANVPDTPEQIGSVSAVTWSLPARTMRVRSTGLVEISDTAWTELGAGVSWLASPIGESWLEETA